MGLVSGRAVSLFGNLGSTLWVWIPACRMSGPWPRVRGWPRLVGHLGVTAAHVWHDPEHGAEIVLNLGSTRAMSPSFRALFEFVRLLRAVGR